MKVLAIQPRSAALHLSLTELVVINNALNEIVNGRGVPAGTFPDEVDALLDCFHDVLGKVRALLPAGV
jgi:hypothetical protein